METFYGFDFDTMAEVTAGEAPRAEMQHVVEAGGDETFMRGLLFGVLFSIPCWVGIAGAIIALVD
ncbi:MAG: hypothetical protein K0R58_4050 [Ramlibacter sp.]|nr:hypothetical protein [Ramlibacter sp.]